MSDKLVFDLAQEIEGSPNVFVRKDWVNILDNQNQNYNNNQSVLDTSQLSNSNKYMSYREAYLSVPFLITLGQVGTEVINVNLATAAGPANATGIVPADPDLSIGGDYILGLKNWFGQIIHSFSLDYNGTTVCQQTPYINIWNSFKLITSLSLNDVSTQGATIGFYPDNPVSWAMVPTPISVNAPADNTGNYLSGYSTSGNGTVNNNNAIASQMAIFGIGAASNTGGNCFSVVNDGIYKRQQLINFDQNSLTGAPVNISFAASAAVTTPISTGPYSSMLVSGLIPGGLSTQQVYFSNTWKSYISSRTLAGTSLTAGTQYLQYSIVGTIYLKHVHSFFNMCPLLKGVFMKITMNLNNTTSTITSVTNYAAVAAGTIGTMTPQALFCLAVSNPLGGTNPIMMASGAQNTYAGGQAAQFTLPNINLSNWVTGTAGTQSLMASTTPVIASGAVGSGAGGVLSIATINTQNLFGTAANAITLGTYANPYQGGGQVAAANITTPAGGRYLFPQTQVGYTGNQTSGTALINIQYRVNISVGAVCLDQTLANTYKSQGTLSKSVYLYIPSYTFNPIFEQSYLSSPIKQIKYTDVYQYQVLNVATGANFNNLLTNGIANIKSVLVLPFFSTSSGNSVTFSAGTNGVLKNTYGQIPNIAGPTLGFAAQTNNSNTGFAQGVPVWQSPFDPAGSGPTSPLCTLTNFNVQISGQNAIYNIEKYNFEQFNNQLYGQNAVNGGLTDGITSSLIDRQAFDMEYCYYYVNVERMLPVEQSVPKSVQILGQNYSSRALDLYCFIEYGNEISIDALTGARV